MAHRDDHHDDPVWMADVEDEHGPLRPYGHDERNGIIGRMNARGSGFESALGHALLRADEGNELRLRKAFPEVFRKFEARDG